MSPAKPKDRVMHTVWGTFSSDDLEVQTHCERCGKPMYRDTCGNYRVDDAGKWVGVCYPCLRPEED